MVEPRIWYVIAVAVGTVVVAQLVNWLMKRGFRGINLSEERLKMLRIEPLEERRTKFAVVRRLIVFGIYFVGAALIVISLPGAEKVAYSMLAGAGVAAIVIGFAVQNTFANIISGVLIAFTQPFRIGDNIEFRGDYCTVEDIALSFTVLRMWTNKRIIVPNKVLTDEVIHNYTIEDTKMLRPLVMSISYDSDPEKARKIMIDELLKHPEFLDARTQEQLDSGQPIATVLMTALNDSSVNMRMVFAAKDQPTAFRMEHELRERIKKRFEKAGITIPFPQMDLHMKDRKRR